MFDLKKKLSNAIHKLTSPETAEPKPSKTETEQSNVIYNDLDVFKLPEGQGRWTLVIGKEGQGKTYLVKEVAKRFQNFGYVKAIDFQPVKDIDLFIIDDLHEATSDKLSEIFRFLVSARHNAVKNVICVTQELGGTKTKSNIPSEILRRFTVFGFFFSAKQHMKLQTIVRGGLKEASEMANRIISLMPRHYMLYDVQTGFLKNPPLVNTEVDLLLKAMKEPIPIQKPKTEVKRKPKTQFTLEEGVKITYVVASYALTHPEVRYSAVAEKFGIQGTVEQRKSYVKQCVHRFKTGQIRLTQDQAERIAQQFD